MTALNAEQVEALRAFSTPTICNAIETFRVRPRTEGFMDASIACRFPEHGPLAGYAVTAKIRASAPPERETPFAELFAAVERSPRPCVIVIEDLDDPPVGSYWGEVNASVYRALGASGVITNGGVRDLLEVRPLGFHFFSSCVLVSHAYVHLVEVGTPVMVGGLTVHPGDLLHADLHGVTSIPPSVAPQLTEAARKVEADERRLIDYAQSGNADPARLAELYGKVD